MKKFFLVLVNGGQQKYVATESDIDCGGWVDATPEDFGFETKEEAEETRKALLSYASANGWIDPEIIIEEQRISTMEELAEYINESEEWPVDVEAIIEENGWVSDCGTEFGVCHDASEKVVINDEGKAVCVTMHTVEDVELEKGGYGHDTLSWVLDGEYQDCTGEFYVDKDGMLHHTAIAPNGDEVEITAKYL
jgi:hypothetical protein